jgi:hypothetical protein
VVLCSMVERNTILRVCGGNSIKTTLIVTKLSAVLPASDVCAKVRIANVFETLNPINAQFLVACAESYLGRIR